MEQAVGQRGDGGGVAEKLSPVVDRPVRGEQRRRPLVAAHDQLEQVFGGGVRQLSHAEIVDDEHGHAGQLGQIGLAGVGERDLGEARGREFEDERAVDLRVEGEVEAVERAVGVTESGLLVPPVEQPVLAPLEFVVDDRRDEVDGGHPLGRQIA